MITYGSINCKKKEKKKKNKKKIKIEVAISVTVHSIHPGACVQKSTSSAALTVRKTKMRAVKALHFIF
jgi:hypothetical protein